MNNITYDVIIIGAGPAGVFCAISLKEKNKDLKIAIFEKGKPLTKLVQSGGGRCNLSNKKANFKDCLPYYPRGSRFISHLFYQYDVESFCRWLYENKIEIKIEKEDKIFLNSDDSKQLESLFLQKLDYFNIEIIKAEFCDFDISSDGSYDISIENNAKDGLKNEKYFKVFVKEKILKDIEFEDKEKKIYFSKFLVIACGSNKAVLDIIKNKGIDIIEFAPSLYGFKINEIAESNLAGVSVNDVSGYLEFPENIEDKNSDKFKEGKKVETKKEKAIKVKQDLLFTHEGLSGPLILKLSSYNAFELSKNDFKAILHLDFISDKNFEEVEKKLSEICHKGAKIIKNIYSELNIPMNLWKFFLFKSDISYEKMANQITKEETKRLVQLLKNFKIKIDGKSNNKDEFVSAGGVDLSKLDKNCMSKNISNLYFIGEILNIDGITGGYNLQSCWTTAYVCADSIAKSFFQNQK